MEQEKNWLISEPLPLAVLERCHTLCGQYGIQTDFQLGAIYPLQGARELGAISHLYTRIKEKADFPYYMEKPAGNYLYLFCQGRWNISEGYVALASYLYEHGVSIVGPFYAWLIPQLTMKANKLTPGNNSTGKLKQGHVGCSVLFWMNQEFTEPVEKRVCHMNGPAAWAKIRIAF